ncbi:MAG: glycogen synthase [Elusimicrobia bacterium]|nr:glycogen synthase [Elusimicrobiota bacterium]
MRVVLAASEAVPFSKTGGLADVAGALPGVLSAAGAQAVLFTPLYPAARAAAPALRRLAELSVPMGGAAVRCAVLGCARGESELRFIDAPAFFDRPGLYGAGGADYPDNAERFAFFSRAVLEACRALRLRPDVLHLHDWQTALAAAYLKTVFKDEPFFAKTACLFTIHNMAYQGVFPRAALAAAGLPPSEFSPAKLEFWGKVSYLKAGLVHADLITTVSETYAKEIQTPEFGGGLEGLLRARSADLVGVRNGLDLATWDPERDQDLPAPYGAADAPAGKAAAKAAVQKELGLEARADAMLIGSVTRFDPQKGLDIALAAAGSLLGAGAQYVLHGSGDPALERAAADFARRHPGRCAVSRSFDDRLARRIYAASDVFLMPSRFEPCGLGQLIAMRYGSVPVATRTGGLADTVTKHGFMAARPDADGVRAALAEAGAAYADRSGWAERVRLCMAADWGWGPSGRRYMELYSTARARVARRR